jgi:hypothetical protein
MSGIIGRQYAHMVKTILLTQAASDGYPGHNRAKKFSFFLFKKFNFKKE